MSNKFLDAYKQEIAFAESLKDAVPLGAGSEDSLSTFQNTNPTFQNTDFTFQNTENSSVPDDKEDDFLSSGEQTAMTTEQLSDFQKLLSNLEASKKRQQQQKFVEGRRDIYAQGLAAMMSNF